MEFLGDVLNFFADGSNWVGSTGILNRTLEHVGLSAFSMVIASLIAIPPALYLGHTGRGGFFAVSIVNIGRAVPSFAIVALALPVSIKLGLGLGFWPTFLALVALALPPMFTNTYTGVREVDQGTVEAALGMGMTGWEVLSGIEMPLASPVILAAVRVAAVQVVATATLGALVAWGGLGRYIIDGFSQGDTVEVFVGGVLVALLAVATQLVFGWLERRAVPSGLRGTNGAGRGRVEPVRQVA
ncbi:MAG: ABC transporter permease [Acidimicrobiia bacterium]|nr:ABC transporter permease [Acidimicrobiia bacterium]